MILKTEYGYNEDDFVQSGENMQELTVTITLCEYRNLIKDITYQDNTIEKLKEENKKLKEQNNTYQGYIIANHPEIIEKLGDLGNALINTPKADNEQDAIEKWNTRTPQKEGEKQNAD